MAVSSSARITSSPDPLGEKRDERLRGDRLGSEIRAPRLQASFPIPGQRFRGQCDDGQVGGFRSLADTARRLEPVDLRHHHVHEYEIYRTIRVEQLEALLRPARREDVDPMALEKGGGRIQVVHVVVHQ